MSIVSDRFLSFLRCQYNRQHLGDWLSGFLSLPILSSLHHRANLCSRNPHKTLRNKQNNVQMHALFQTVRVYREKTVTILSGDLECSSNMQMFYLFTYIKTIQPSMHRTLTHGCRVNLISYPIADSEWQLFPELSLRIAS